MANSRAIKPSNVNHGVADTTIGANGSSCKSAGSARAAAPARARSANIVARNQADDAVCVAHGRLGYWACRGSGRAWLGSGASSYACACGSTPCLCHAALSSGLFTVTLLFVRFATVPCTACLSVSFRRAQEQFAPNWHERPGHDLMSGSSMWLAQVAGWLAQAATRT